MCSDGLDAYPLAVTSGGAAPKVFGPGAGLVANLEDHIGCFTDVNGTRSGTLVSPVPPLDSITGSGRGGEDG